MADRHETSETNCPFINRNDPRCAGNLSLCHIDRAFNYCINHPDACPTYHQISAEQDQPHDQPTVHVTIAGRIRRGLRRAAS